MQARSALFDLYGDHLRVRGGRAPVAALVRLLAPVKIAAPAVRTAVSRMVRQGWLAPARLTGGPGYQLTPKASRRLDEAASRIYRTARAAWDGRFDLLIVVPPADRRARERLADDLTFLGYGRLGDETWVGARPSAEVDQLLIDAGIPAERFSASHHRGVPGSMALVRSAWDLAAVGAAYTDFVERMRPVVAPVNGRSPDDQAYAARFVLVHEWRSFLFRDPQLPAALLPDDWPGATAASFFDRHAARLRPAADRFVATCLEES
ncbi:PaaX family transcriptional regulator [Allocatelliglobosispora scoriae]|uniref:PaaX family transcriptional regulator n=1 Tax=Allocatelliglobosispora scoriae TaxID=643052 RepID=UPI0016084FA9|nr:PaaX family transcriptional regulator C-terminal domain-containing protein [Allocatelliglobosispora scoriae]